MALFTKYLEILNRSLISEGLGWLIQVIDMKVTVPLIENLIANDRSLGYGKWAAICHQRYIPVRVDGSLPLGYRWYYYIGILSTFLFSSMLTLNVPCPSPVAEYIHPFINSWTVPALLELDGYDISRCLECPSCTCLPIKCSTDDSCP